MPSGESGAGEYERVSAKEPPFDVVPRTGRGAESATWRTMTRFVGVIHRLSMRAIAPEREWDGRRWCRGRISARGTPRETASAQGTRSGGGGRPTHRECNQRVSTGLSGCGGRPGYRQDSALAIQESPFRQGTRRSVVYISCVHQASCRRSAGALGWEHQSRARQSLFTPLLAFRLDRRRTNVCSGRSRKLRCRTGCFSRTQS